MLFNIQILRGVAAYLVVVVHLDGLLKLLGMSAWPVQAGTTGVDLFFVISGFVMVYTTTRRSVTPVAFSLNRMVRIVPMYWLLTLAVFALAVAGPSGLLGATRPSLPELFKSLFFVPFAKSNGLVQPMLFLGWTLNYEMFFYLIFAVSLNLKRPLWRVATSSVAICLLCLSGYLLQPHEVVLRFFTAPIMLEFMMGMWLGLAHEHGFKLVVPVAVGAILSGSCVMLGHFAVIEQGERAIWSGLPAMVIVAGALSLERSGIFSRNRLLQLLGAASYSLYLVHPFVTMACTKLALRLGAAHASFLAWTALCFALVVAGIVGVALHRCVERPLSSIFRLRARHAPSIVEQNEEAVLGAPASPI